MLVTNEIYSKRQTQLSLVALLIWFCYRRIFPSFKQHIWTMNYLFALKKKPLRFLITKRNQHLQVQRTFMWVQIIFHFRSQLCVSVNPSHLLPLLNLVKWDTDEGINSHVVYGEAPIELQDPQIKWILLHWRDLKKASPAITILWHSRLSLNTTTSFQGMAAMEGLCGHTTTENTQIYQ